MAALSKMSPEMVVSLFHAMGQEEISEMLSGVNRWLRDSEDGFGAEFRKWLTGDIFPDEVVEAALPHPEVQFVMRVLSPVGWSMAMRQFGCCSARGTRGWTAINFAKRARGMHSKR